MSETRDPTRYDAERLYELLPAIYRLRDAERGKPLAALLEVIAEQVAVLEENLDQLYDDQFIETCAEWAVPYLGDLLGVRALSPVTYSAAYSQRAYVANTIAYRRRKGTAAVLEQLALDVTGWRARAVEYFERLAATQHLNHVRVDRPAWLDLGNGDALDLLGGPFDAAGHTADVRRVAVGRGRHNIPNVGLFLWRLGSYGLSRVPATRAKDPGPTGPAGRYRFSPLGHDMPLFHQPETETEITHLAEEINVPGPIRPFALYLDLEGQRQGSAAGGSRYYGDGRSLAVYRDGALVEPDKVVCRDLDGWKQRPQTGKVAIDVARGRLALPLGDATKRVEVSYSYGFSADLGGGPYDRQRSLVKTDGDWLVIELAKSSGAFTGTADLEAKTLQEALKAWLGPPPPQQQRRRCHMRILDNGVYGGQLRIALPAGAQLVIEAADGRRPSVRSIVPIEISGPADASLTLNGLLVEGELDVQGSFELNLLHSTLVPGRGLETSGEPVSPKLPSLHSTGDARGLKVALSYCITGPLWLPGSARLMIADSIVDSPQRTGLAVPAIAGGADSDGPMSSIDRSTVFGPVRVRRLDASEAIFAGRVRVVRRQTGCVRFSYLPGDSRTPRRYHCQADLALDELARRLGRKSTDALTAAERREVLCTIRPLFTSQRYGRPGYAQLRSATAPEIRAGGEDGTEMGAFHHLQQPQRQDNLRAALEEYLRFGFETGVFYAT